MKLRVVSWTQWIWLVVDLLIAAVISLFLVLSIVEEFQFIANPRPGIKHASGVILGIDFAVLFAVLYFFAWRPIARLRREEVVEQRRPWTWRQRIELFFGVVLPYIYVFPLWFLPGFLAAISGPFPGSLLDIFMRLLFLSITAIGFVGLWFLWELICLGPEEINRHPFRRRLTLAICIAWLLGDLVGFFVYFESRKGGSPLPSLFLVALIGSCVVWLRYLPKLFKRGVA